MIILIETFILTKYKFYTRLLNDAQDPDSLLEKRKLNVEWNVALKNLYMFPFGCDLIILNF